MLQRVSLFDARLQNKIILQLFAHWSNLNLLSFVGPSKLFITGSRSPAMELSYPESDLDVALVVETEQEKTQTIDSILRSNQQGKCFSGQKVVVYETLAGLKLIPVENIVLECFGVTYELKKLDITIRLRKDHEIIQSHAENSKREKFSSDLEMENYINRMRQLKLSGDETQYGREKDWLRVPKLNFH